MKFESRQHAAEPHRAKAGGTSSPVAFFESLPAEIFMTSVVFAFEHGFFVPNPETTEVIKFTVGFSQGTCRIFPAGLTPVQDASRKRWPCCYLGLLAKVFYDFRSSGPQIHIFRSLVDI